jgi:hypothetical protein
VADDLVRAAEIAAVPGEPHRAGRRPERRGGPVQVAEQGPERGRAVQAPRARPGELPLDERQHLAPVRIQAGTHQPRRGGEVRLLEVAQQRVHGRRPRPGLADNHVTAAVDDRPAAFQADRLIR